MAQDDLFGDKPAEQGRNPWWVMYGACCLLIIASFVCTLWHSSGKIVYGADWEYYHLIYRGINDLAFVCLLGLTIWFVPRRNDMCLAVLAITLVNLAEHLLYQRICLGGFYATPSLWRLEIIDSSLVIILAIVSMPLLKRITSSKLVFTQSISIVDMLLLMTAAAALTSVARYRAASTLDVPGFEFTEWDSTAEYLMSSFLLSVVGLVVVYVAFFGRLFWGGCLYLLTWLLYMGVVNLVDVRVKKLTIIEERLNLQSVWFGDYDHFIPVFSCFLLGIVFARLASRWLDGQVPSPIDLGENSVAG
ncbi:MAG: hypothetical protein ACI87E_000288 [Mariniblastus sp.]|jgi:hypothetical protein